MVPEPSETQSLMYLFGGSKPWLAQDWTSSDDRVRGGSSISRLVVAAAADPSRGATFSGTLDTRTLGGAGFAAQRTTAPDLALDLRPYARGVVLDVAHADGLTYTLVLKDELPLSLGEDEGGGGRGRERSGVSWEAAFTPGAVGAGREEKEKKKRVERNGMEEERKEEEEEERKEEEEEEEEGGEKVLLRWEDFKAMYRGREKKDAGELKRGKVRRVSIMCRSFFGKQEGDFELAIRSIAAVKEEAETRYRDDPDGRTPMKGEDEKRNSIVSATHGWLGWMFGACGQL